MPKQPDARCLTPECCKPRGAQFRGLCMTCYSAAKKMVESRTTTWEALERLGMVESKSDLFTKAFMDRIDQ